MKLSKKHSNIFLVVLIIVILMCCCGCSPHNTADSEEAALPLETESDHTPSDNAVITTDTETVTTDSSEEPSYQDDPAAFVVFFRNTAEHREVHIPIDEIMEYESLYPDCNGTWFKDQLADEDLCIYNSYLYAMENCFIGFRLYVEDSSKGFHHIRESVCLDSPFLEQNYNQYKENITPRPTTNMGHRVFFRVEQFTKERWDMKMEALELCRQIVAGIPPEYTTQLEKMEYLYQYVCDNVTYTEYEDMGDVDHFYDAVCLGKAVCDGYSNMLSMLFNLIGVNCTEAMGSDIQDFSTATPEELENFVGGHTWVVAEVDGVFYNFDPTFDDTKGEGWETINMFFGFSDQLVSVRYLDFEDTRPKCADTSRDYHFSDLTVDSLSDLSAIQEISELTAQRAENGQFITLIAIRDLIEQDDFDLFMDLYFDYVYNISTLDAMAIDIGNATILRLTVRTW